MGMLFISHSSKDNKRAEVLRDALRDQGFESLFLDIDPAAGIAAGEEWQRVLYRRLRSCNALVAVVTDEFLKSHWCFAEVALARMQGKHLFGIQLPPLASDAKLTALLDDRQLVDGRADFASAVRRLVRGLERAGLSAVHSLAWNRDRSPYPGFSPFEEEDAGVYFGRDEEIVRGIEMVRGSVQGTAARMVMLLGASGSGKSSLLRAGMVPRLRREERLQVIGPFRPGPEPLEELAWEVASAFGVASDRLAMLTRNPPAAELSLERLVRRLLREEGSGNRHAVCLIDQFEELLDRPAGHSSHTFLTLMHNALQSAEGSISFVGTLRSDQLARLQSHPVGRRLEWQTLFLAPLDALRLREVIERPAQLAELELEPGLTDHMIADTPSPHALPLLALTLRRLWERYRDDGVLQVEEYRQLGGVTGAVARVAEDALAGKDAEEIESLREALLTMVRLDENGNAVRQPARWDATPPAARPLLERFINNRLLVRDGSEVQVTHEALFTAWTRLSEWIAEDREVLLVQQRVAQAARSWEEEQDEGALWRGARLERALDLWRAERLRLDAGERTFLDASRRAEEAAREERERRERERERLSRVALGRGLAYQAQGEAEDRPQRGLLLAIEAVETSRPAGRNAVAAAENVLRDLLCRFAGESLADLGSPIRCVAAGWMPEQLAVGCEDGTVALLQIMPDRTLVRSWRPHERGIVAVAIASGGLLAARTADGAVFVRDLLQTDGAPFREYAPAGSEETVSALAPGEPFLAVARKGEMLRVHDLDHGREWSLPDEGAPTRALAFSPGFRWLADAREDGQVVLWDPASLADQPRGIGIPAHEAAIRHIVWAADGGCFVTADRDGRVRRWCFGDAPGELSLIDLQSSGSPILDLQVSRTGDLVVAGTWHSEAFCWMADDQFAQPVVLRGHSSSVGSVAIAPGDRWIATASPRDNSALLWAVPALRADPRPIRFRGEDHWLERVAFLADGSVVAAGSAGTIRRWTRPAEEPWEMRIPGVDLNRYALSADGMHLLAAGAQVAFGGSPDMRAKLVSLIEERIDAIEDPDSAVAVATTPDARFVVVGSRDGVVSVRDSASGGERRLAFALKGWFSKLAIAPSGRWLVVDGGDGPTLIDLDTDSEGVRLDVHQTFLRSATFDVKGEELLLADAAGLVTHWKRDDTGFARARSLRHEGVWWCAFRAGGAGWVSGSGESLLVVGPDADAEPQTLELGWRTDQPRFALSRAGHRVVAASNVQVASWDLGVAAPAETRVELPRHEGAVDAVAVSADGGRIATSMIDGPVRIWEASAPTHPVILPRHQAHVMLLAFIDGDRRLVTGEQEGSLAVWDLDLDGMVARARRVAGRELTPEERSRFLAL